MAWLHRVALGCVVSLALSTALAGTLGGCSGDSESCVNCGQSLEGTGASAAASTGTGGLSATSQPSGGVAATDPSAAGGTGGAAPGTGGFSTTSQPSGGVAATDPSAAGGTGGIAPGTAGDQSTSTGGGLIDGTGGALEQAPERCSQIDGPTAEAMVADGAVLLDVRDTTTEYDVGHAEGAINIPVDELSSRVGELPADSAIIVYCRSGNRSSRANTILCDLGFDVFDLGAYSNWTGNWIGG